MDEQLELGTSKYLSFKYLNLSLFFRTPYHFQVGFTYIFPLLPTSNNRIIRFKLCYQKHRTHRDVQAVAGRLWMTALLLTPIAGNGIWHRRHVHHASGVSFSRMRDGRYSSLIIRPFVYSSCPTFIDYARSPLRKRLRYMHG